jgi:hypothetical protein
VHPLRAELFPSYYVYSTPRCNTLPLQDELAACAKAEMEREQEAELQRQRQIVERKRAALQSQIFVVTATYRRTQAELNALIVEVRHGAVLWWVLSYLLC